MADNYLEFSEIIANLTGPEEAWLKEQLQPIRVFDGKGHRAEVVPFLLDKTDYDLEWDALGFEYRFHDDNDPGGWGRHLWFYTEDWGNADNVAWLVQKFLKQFRPQECWSLSYAATCSKPRIGEFGGGAVFVTADTIVWQNSGDFIESQRAAFDRKEATA